MATDTKSMVANWTPDSWRAFEALQQPVWPDETALKAATDQLAQEPPLVFAGEARSLTSELASVANGRAFVLQAGDCAESFDGFGANAIRDKLKVILQMAAVLTYSARARVGAPVAVPIAWDELDAMKDAHPFSIDDAAGLIERSKKLQGWGFAEQALPDYREPASAAS